jgi:hypothetical protein
MMVLPRIQVWSSGMWHCVSGLLDRRDEGTTILQNARNHFSNDGAWQPTRPEYPVCCVWILKLLYPVLFIEHSCSSFLFFFFNFRPEFDLECNLCSLFTWIVVYSKVYLLFIFWLWSSGWGRMVLSVYTILSSRCCYLLQYYTVLQLRRL